MKIKKNGAWENFILPVSVPTMKGASSTSDGTKGLVPQPSLGDQNKYLKADGTWSTINIPDTYTLPDATTIAKGGVQIGDNITVSSGIISLTKANIINALGYTPPTTNTSYGVATNSSNGLMSSTDKSKLDKIEAGANNYIHPSSHPASMITGLSAVAKTGSYNDLTNKPNIPSDIIVDTELSSTSTNPVQNKIIKEVVDNCMTINNTNIVTIEELVKTSDASKNLTISGSNTPLSGARMILSGNSSSNNGSFILYTSAKKGTNEISQLIGSSDGSLSWSGDFTANKVFNAVYNDYAEYFPKGKDNTEPGDIIMLDLDSNKEEYIKAYINDKNKDKNIVIVGIHSNEYGHLIGGENVPKELSSKISFEDYNKDKYIPIGLIGRCHVKIKGKAFKGATVIISDTPGVGICSTEKNIDNNLIVGYLLEEDSQTGIRKLKIKMR